MRAAVSWPVRLPVPDQMWDRTSGKVTMDLKRSTTLLKRCKSGMATGWLAMTLVTASCNGCSSVVLLFRVSNRGLGIALLVAAYSCRAPTWPGILGADHLDR